MGAPAVASVGVSVWAKTGAFTRGMRRSRKQLRIFNKNIQEASRTIVRFGAVMTGVAGGAMAQLVRTSVKTIDTAAKTARKLGLTTEALTGLQHAAELSGVAVRTFDMGLQRMTRRIAEAAVGTGEAKDAIKELGLDARRLDTLTTDEKFLEIADALSEVENQAQRVRLGFKLFDSEGVALINMAEGGSEAIKKLMARARLLGLTFDKDAAGSVEKVNDALTELRASVKGVGNALAFRFAKDIESAVKKLTAFAVWVRTSKSSIKAFAIEMGKLGFKTVALIAGLSGVIIVGGQVVKLLNLLSKAFQALTKAVAIFHSFAGPKGWITLAAGVAVAVTAVAGANAAFGSVKDEMAGIVSELDGITDGITKAGQATQKATANAAALDQLRKRRQGRTDATRARSEEFGRQAAQIRLDLRTPSEVFGNEVDKLNMLYRRGVMDIETYDRALAQANRDFEDASGVTALAEAAKDAAKEMKQAGQDLTSAMRTPMQVYRDELEKINHLYLQGAVSQETWRRALEDARDTLEQDSQPKSHFASAAGSELSRFRRVGTTKARIQKTEDKVTHAKLDRLDSTVATLDLSRVP